MERMFLKECYVENIYHYNALDKDIWNKLLISEQLSISEHIENEVVKVEYEGKIVGSLSKDDSKDIIPYVKQGWNHIFTAVISYRDQTNTASENKVLKVIVYINRRGK